MPLYISLVLNVTYQLFEREKRAETAPLETLHETDNNVDRNI